MPKLHSNFQRMAANRNLLLLSKNFSGLEQEMADRIIASPASTKTVAYIPYALERPDAYLAQIEAALLPFGINIASVHDAQEPGKIIKAADGILVDGGNTFRLLDKLQKTGLFSAIREKVNAGTPYFGISAGISIAGPTIKTTNDPEILTPSSLAGFHFLPFQVSPHYSETGPHAATISRFHEKNPVPVVALRDGSGLSLLNGKLTVTGKKSAVLFARGKNPVEINSGNSVWPKAVISGRVATGQPERKCPRG